MHELGRRPAGAARVDEPGRTRLRDWIRKGDSAPRLLLAVRFARELLPGDSELGDPLSTAGGEAPHLLARSVAEVGAREPSVARELGLGALQVWQALSEAQGRGRGEEDVAILFLDLVGFSAWALQAGDEAAVTLLRDFGRITDGAVVERGGRVVKRLGDGAMAVFADAGAAVEAARHACREVATMDVDGYEPALRAGLHVGRPRHLGGDYLGVAVNVAARVAEAAKAGEVLISETARERLPPDAYPLRKRRRFRAKGAPDDLAVYAVG
ncbi:MAG TPA: adenylate/guanylate cyclase domain-containing protein [Solirubrobacteraceae bacterium]|nr:adenylate/guanylate cyclase domain-containing protein [Solirubrobacteraceae bacterium]